MIAAPSSGSGKTVVTLGLLRALRNKGLSVGSLKVGPDYIDPAYHTAATGAPCRNFDLWAMRKETLQAQCRAAADNADLIVAEGVMGLFDGAATGDKKDTGSTADAAAWLNWPVVLVVDSGGQGTSAAALVQGFASFRDDVEIGGVIFNRIGGPAHEEILLNALESISVPCFGCISRHEDLALESRHLGLVQAREKAELDRWLDVAAGRVTESLDLDRLTDLARPEAIPEGAPTETLPSFAQHIAIARDEAFAFCYNHILDGWQQDGVTLSFFSPLADEGPSYQAGGVYLPGGYPELHGNRLSANGNFLNGLRQAQAREAVIYGECGGFMVMGDTLTDKEGVSHAMAGLLPVATSFAEPKLHLGYRDLTLLADGPLGKRGQKFSGHEFHYSSLTQMAGGASLFEVGNSKGEEMPAMGCRLDNAIGSFAHLIDSR